MKAKSFLLTSDGGLLSKVSARPASYLGSFLISSATEYSKRVLTVS